jgi:hypothetical protein
LLSAFETGDQRKVAWTKTVTISGVPYTYPYKYKIGNNATSITENNILLRFSEQYLIWAEARAQLGNLSGAINDLNIIRTRAGLANTPAVSQADILKAIQVERRVELFTELGFRWFDLKRWGIAAQVLAPLKPDWQETDLLYPIPLSQIDYNPFLTQNPGY